MIRSTIFALTFIFIGAISINAQAARIPPGVVLYVEPTDFGQALSAAILKKQVPVRVTTDREKATYFLTSTTQAKTEGQGERIAKVLVLGAWAGNGKSRDSSVSITDANGVVAFAYNTRKSNFQSAAEGVAKNLKNHIENK
jgi:hypothetical protein